MSSNRQKSSNQRRNNSNYYSSNNNNNQQQNNKNQQPKRPRYQPKHTQNTNNNSNQRYNNNNSNNSKNYRNNNNQNNDNRQYSPKQSPKRYPRGPSSPNNRAQNRSNRSYHAQSGYNNNNDDPSYNSNNNNNTNSGQRFKLKPTGNNNQNQHNSQQRYHSNSSNNNSNNYRNNQHMQNNSNSQGYNRRRTNNSNNNNNNNNNNNYVNQDMDNNSNKPIPPGFRGNNDGNISPNSQTQNYPPNRYRPNETNNSERNRNWRNRYNPPPDTQTNRGYNNASNDNTDRYARSHHSHSRSPPSGPYNPSNTDNANNNSNNYVSSRGGTGGGYNNNTSNLSISTNSPGFQPHNTPTLNPSNNTAYKSAASPLLTGVQTPGSDHSMTPASYRRVNPSNLSGAPQNNPSAQHLSSGTPNINGLDGTQQNIQTATNTASDLGNAAGELFGVIYGQSGTEPSIAYPVIKLCLNQTIQPKDITPDHSTNLEATLPSESKQQRKYPVDWLLGVGKEIREPPNHPRDDIPESVKFTNTIKIAGNRWKQHRNTMSVTGNITNSPSLNTNSPIPTGSARFAPIHQLPPHQLTQNLNNNNSNTSTHNQRSSSDADEDRSWRNKANKEEPTVTPSTQTDNNNNNKDAADTTANTADAVVEDKMITPQSTDAMDTSDNLKPDEPSKKPALDTNDNDSNPIPQLEALQITSNTPPVLNPTDDAETPALNPTDDTPQKELPKNGAVSMEDLENQLRAKQQATPTTEDQPSSTINKEPAAEDVDTDEAAAAQQIDETDVDLEQFQAIHHTPELKPDPREMVEEDENDAPEWAEGSDEDANIVSTDFQFGVIDKARDRAHFKETGNLPSEAPTISNEEYQRRKQLQLQKKQEALKQAQQAQIQGQPTRPPLAHGQQPPLHATNIFPHHQAHHAATSQNINQFEQYPPSQQALARHPALTPRSREAAAMRSQSTPDGHIYASNKGNGADAAPLPIDKLPSRIRNIVIRLDEDIAKISTYIQQVKLEDDQLNRYQRHLNKLIARRGQYANWWKSQQLKGNQLEQLNKVNEKKTNSVSVGLRHTNSLQQLEHYKDYYNKQLNKMILSANNDPKFSTYVDYYRQKLKAVEKRQRELESRQSKTANVPVKDAEVVAVAQVQSANVDGVNNTEEQPAISPQKGSSIIDVISDPNQQKQAIQNALQRQNENANKPPAQLISNPPQNDNDDPFGSLLNLDDLGYSKAAPHSKPTSQLSLTQNPNYHDVPAQHPPHATATKPDPYSRGATRAAPTTATSQPPQQPPTHPQQTMDDAAMYTYMYGNAPPNSAAAQTIRQQRSAHHQKQKLKAYIRQHALKYVKPPPDPNDETYPQWYQGLRKVENIIYQKYMNKQRKRMEAQQAALRQQQATGSKTQSSAQPPTQTKPTPDAQGPIVDARKSPQPIGQPVVSTQPPPTQQQSPRGPTNMHQYPPQQSPPRHTSPYHAPHASSPRGPPMPPTHHPAQQQSPYYTSNAPPSQQPPTHTTHTTHPQHPSHPGPAQTGYGPPTHPQHAHPSGHPSQSPPNYPTHPPQHAPYPNHHPSQHPHPSRHHHTVQSSPPQHPSGHPSQHPPRSHHGSPNQQPQPVQGNQHRMSHLNISHQQPTSQHHPPTSSGPHTQHPSHPQHPQHPPTHHMQQSPRSGPSIHSPPNSTHPPYPATHHQTHPQSLNSPPMYQTYHNVTNQSPPMSPKTGVNHNKYPPQNQGPPPPQPPQQGHVAYPPQPRPDVPPSHRASHNQSPGPHLQPQHHHGPPPHPQQQHHPAMYHHHYQQSPPNPTTTSQGYTTYNTSSPPNPHYPPHPHPHQYPPQNARSPPNPHQYPPMHYADVPDH